MSSREIEFSVRLSTAQVRYFYVHSMTSGASAYNTTLSFEVLGNIRTDLLAKAFVDVIARHEILRSEFRINERGHLVSRVRAQTQLVVDERDLRHSSMTENKIENMARDFASAPLDIENGQLLRLCIAHFKEDRSIFILVTHHIASDAVSISILLKETAAVYTARTQNQPYSLPDVRQYRQIAEREYRSIETGAFRESLNFWREELTQIPSEVSLSHHARPTKTTLSVSTHSLSISATLYTALRDTIRREKITLFTILATAIGMAIKSLSGQDDVIIGFPVANRIKNGDHSIVGPMMNTLPLRMPLTDLDAAGQLLKSTSLALTRALKHQSVPFDLLVKELNPPRQLGRHPLFQIWLNYRSLLYNDLRFGEARIVNHVRTAPQSWLFDLGIIFEQHFDGLRCFIDYSDELFELSTVVNFSTKLVRCLELIADAG